MFPRFCAILLFISVLGFMHSTANAENTGFISRLHTVTPPRPLPDFLIDDDKGRRLTISDFSGRYVLMNFWATWCAPCVKEMPSLDRLAAQMDPTQIAIVAANENSRGMEVTPAFYAQHGLKNLGVYVDVPGRALPLLQIRGLPVTLIIDRQGNEIARVEGDEDWSAPDVIEYLRNLTKK